MILYILGKHYKSKVMCLEKPLTNNDLYAILYQWEILEGCQR